MKKHLAFLFFIFALTVAACGPSSEKNAAPEQTASVYQCPMKCEGEKTYDKPGKCPVCGMDLKPAEALTPQAPDSSAVQPDSISAV